jgi:hypothetical protein
VSQTLIFFGRAFIYGILHPVDDTTESNMKIENIRLQIKSATYILDNKQLDTENSILLLILDIIEDFYNAIFKYENDISFEILKKELVKDLEEITILCEKYFSENNTYDNTRKDYLKTEIADHLDFIFKYLSEYNNTELFKRSDLYLEIENMHSEILILKKEIFI